MNTTSAGSAFAPFIAALAKAHAAAQPLVELTGATPATVAEAMSVQARVAAELGARVAGWKVGYAPDGTPVAAPIFAHFLWAMGARVPLKQGGVWGVEPEIAVKLGRDLPPRPGQPYSRAEIVGAIAAVLPGIEIVASRIIGHQSAPFPAFVADNIGNAGYVTGAELADWRHLDLAALRATLSFDGASAHDAVGGHPNGDPLKPLRDYANAPCDALGGLKAGQVITTGSLCGLVPVPGPAAVVMALEGVGEARLLLEAYPDTLR